MTYRSDPFMNAGIIFGDNLNHNLGLVIDQDVLGPFYVPRYCDCEGSPLAGLAKSTLAQLDAFECLVIK